MTDCSVCLEVKDDLKCLPCWHVFCQTCLHEIRGRSERTLKCPICRNLCLSGNTENLPSVSCGSCGKFRVNPKWFQPCMHVHCSECITTLLETTDGKQICLICQSAPEGGIKTLLICQRCHCLHSDVELSCEHSLCRGCCRQDGSCTLCKVITEDQQSAVEQRQRALVEHLGSILLQNNQIRDSLRHGAFENRLQRMGNTNQQSQEEKDSNRAFMFVVCFLFPAYYWGISFGLWLVSILIYLVTKPTHEHMMALTQLCAIVLQTLSLYYYFYITLLVMFFNLLSIEIPKRFWCFGDNTKLPFTLCIQLIFVCRGCAVTSTQFILLIRLFLGSFFPSLNHQCQIGIYFDEMGSLNK